VIELHGVTKSYGERVAVDQLDLNIARGELLALVGGSGSGKTTTLKLINRLVEPTAGTITLGGRDTREFEPHALRRKIGYVFQDIGLFPHMTIAENVAITPRLCGWPTDKIARRTEELLRLVELGADVSGERFPHELSGGQRQRVGIARALAAEPEVLLLDEPFGALDPITRRKLQRLLQRIRGTYGFTAVLVTHDVSEAFLLGSRVAVLRSGRLLQLGTPEAIREQPADDYVRAFLSGDGDDAEREDEPE
jgi:osmoprotectant transport system ATP-binding protein